MRRRQSLHPYTIIINKEQKKESKIARLQALDWLAQTFPKVFDNRYSIHPLKKGIITEILQYADQAKEHGISKSKLREAIVIYTRRLDYLTCLKGREMRIDLDGNPTELVTVEESEQAALKIRRRIEKTLIMNRQNKLHKKTLGFTKKSETLPLNYSLAIASAAQPDMIPATAYTQQGLLTIAAKERTSKISIKHKTTRSFDPEAVARLKAKLGLAQNNMAEEEMSH